MCCFQKVNPCCEKTAVVIKPFKFLPPPFCCCENKRSACDNCGGLCGPITGSPIHFTKFHPEPKEPHKFAKALEEALGRATERRAGRSTTVGAPPSSLEMDR